MKITKLQVFTKWGPEIKEYLKAVETSSAQNKDNPSRAKSQQTE